LIAATSEDTMKNQGTRSMEQRLAHFKQRLPALNLRKMRLIYKISGIKKKVFLKQPHNNKKYSTVKKKEMVVKMRRLLRQAKCNRKEILQVDDSLFVG
jgi:hypothetical protein